MFAKLFSATLLGLDTQLIEVEVDFRNGMSFFAIVGLPDKAVQEARERIISAIRNSGAEHKPKRIVVNLAPADMHKSGPSFDLAIATALLLATEQLDFDTRDKAFLGELALDGKVREINGILPLVSGLQKLGFTEVYLPSANAAEAALIPGIKVFPVTELMQLVAHFRGQQPIYEYQREPRTRITAQYIHDFADVKGQAIAKQAMEICAAGGHNLLLSGVPGSGKTMMAKCLPSILPEMSLAESLETSKIYSLIGKLDRSAPLVWERPFRSPHHTASSAALVGGGNIPRPGEVSLAHLGVLFLDELPEFSTAALEALRQPMEDGTVTVSRATQSVTFPARFRLVAAMNPCRCGYLGSPDRECTCHPRDVSRYRRKISGPILDRIDLQVRVPKVDSAEIQSSTLAETSSQIAQRVAAAFATQRSRYDGSTLNATMSPHQIREFIQLSPDSQRLLDAAQQKYGLSTRAYYKLLKVARTIADLRGSKCTELGDFSQALNFRMEM